MGLISRESFLLLNSVLLVVATGAVLLGTIYPLVIDALNLGKLSVGPPYFNLVFAPLMVPLLFIMIPGTVARWGAMERVQPPPDWLTLNVRLPMRIVPVRVVAVVQQRS